jgi:thymidine kinase
MIEDNCKGVLKIIHHCDNRDLNKCGSTHNFSYRTLDKKITVIRVENLSEIKDKVDNYTLIGIDEGQFFSDLFEIVVYWVEVLGKNVKISALSGDFEKKLFGQTHLLIPYANEFENLNAECYYCQKDHGVSYPAPFSKRIVDDKTQILIGKQNCYVPVCRKHF